jgi:uncharacterized protein YcbX
MENTSNVIFKFIYFFNVFFLSSYRRKPELYGDKAQFGTYLATKEHGIIRVGDRVRVLREDKNF